MAASSLETKGARGGELEVRKQRWGWKRTLSVCEQMASQRTFRLLSWF